MLTVIIIFVIYQLRTYFWTPLYAIIVRVALLSMSFEAFQTFATFAGLLSFIVESNLFVAVAGLEAVAQVIDKWSRQAFVGPFCLNAIAIRGGKNCLQK